MWTIVTKEVSLYTEAERNTTTILYVDYSYEGSITIY